MCGLRVKNFEQGCRNCIQFLQENTLPQNFCQKRFKNSSMFCGLRLKFFGGFVKTAFYIFRGTLSRKIFLRKGYRFKLFPRTAVEKFSEVLSKLLSQFPEEVIERKFLFEDTYKTIFFRSSGEIFLAGSSKLLSIFSKEHLWRTHLFEKNYRFIVFLRAPVESFWAGLWILHSNSPQERFEWMFLVGKML